MQETIECNTLVEVEAAWKAGFMPVVHSGSWTVIGKNSIELRDLAIATLLERSHAIARDSSEVILQGFSSAHLYDHAKGAAYGSTQATLNHYSSIIAYGSARVILMEYAKAEMFGESHVELHGRSSAILNDWTHAVARSESTVELFDSSNAFLYGSSQAILRRTSHVTLYGKSKAELYDETHVSLRGLSKATLHDTSTAQILTPFASVTCDMPDVVVISYVPDPKIVGDCVLVDCSPPKDYKAWARRYGVPLNGSKCTLFKAVDQNFSSTYDFSYAPGTTPQAPDWDMGIKECGGGLHFSPTPKHALLFDTNPKRKFVACPVDLAQAVFHPLASYPNKVKLPGCAGPIWECDENGITI